MAGQREGADAAARAQLTPAFGEWASLVRANAAAARAWDFEVAGLPAADVRSLARREALEAAAGFSARMGVAVAAPGGPDALIVATGHQPDLYHPGVWVKDFALQRLAEQVGATAVDLVVDSDGFETVGISAACVTDGVHRCHQHLAVSAPDATFATSQVPSAEDVDGFCSAGKALLSTLPSAEPGRHFAEFCEHLGRACDDARDLAEAVTFARRRYEAAAGTDYLELPITHVARSKGFSAFVGEIAGDAHRFVEAYNGALASYREATKTRSAAQPFPDLARAGERVELPLWVVADGKRETVWAQPAPEGATALVTEQGAVVATVPADAGACALDAHCSSGEAALIVPKALALTLFARLFLCDLFIHGTGGGRYDRVTDDVCRRYFGVEPPAFVVATLTMMLPLGVPVATDEDVAAAKERLNRLEHNPDASVADATFLSAQERERAVALAAEKRELVVAIAAPDADKKALGQRIREVNAELAALLSPLRQQLAAKLAEVESERAAYEVITDRTYPFCLFSPRDVASTLE